MLGKQMLGRTEKREDRKSEVFNHPQTDVTDRKTHDYTNYTPLGTKCWFEVNYCKSLILYSYMEMHCCSLRNNVNY